MIRAADCILVLVSRCSACWDSQFAELGPEVPEDYQVDLERRDSIEKLVGIAARRSLVELESMLCAGGYDSAASPHSRIVVRRVFRGAAGVARAHNFPHGRVEAHDADRTVFRRMTTTAVGSLTVLVRVARDAAPSIGAGAQHATFLALQPRLVT